MKKYQSINQFKNLIKHVKDATCYVGKDADGKPIFEDLPLPTLTFIALTKSHGTNAGIRLDLATDKITFQSRERELTINSDNAGFCMWASQESHMAEFQKMFDKIKEQIGYAALPEVESIVIFGEWCGGNIQSNVAIHGLQKMFCLFEVHVCHSDELRNHYFPKYFDLVNDEAKLNCLGIYDMHQFGKWSFDINFSTPENHQNDLVDLCMKIETECPIGKFFGKSGTGEGFVMTHSSPKYGWIQCKVKGEKHSGSRVKTIAPVDVEKYAKVDEFVKDVLQIPRLEQGLKYFEEMQIPLVIQNVGQYIKWCVQDVMKEEMDTIIANQLDTKIIANKAGTVARKYFIEKL